MLAGSSRKLLVYASSSASCGGRLAHVSEATEKIAESLKLNIEIVTSKKRFTPIYVYYKEGKEEAIPIYCDNNKRSDAQVIRTALKNMMYVLSFHPKHSALRGLRKEIMRLS